MDNKAYTSHAAPDVSTQEAPPPYSSISSPVGLDYLSTLTRVDVRQKDVTTESGEVIFGLKREFTRNSFSSSIYFELYDKTGRNVIKFAPINACCSSRLEVHINGQYITKLTLKSFIHIVPKFIVRDAASGAKQFTISLSGPGERFLGRIKDMEGNQIGTINKKWNGLAEEAFADSIELQVDFPRDLGVQYKASIIGFCVLFIQESNLQPRE